MKDNQDIMIEEIDRAEEKETDKSEAERNARMDDLIEKGKK